MAEQSVEPERPRIVGSVFEHTIVSGETLTSIGARFGVAPGVLATENRLADPDRLSVGQVLRIDNRHIVPEWIEDGIVLNLPQRMLFHFLEGRLVAAYPAAVGRPDSPTPTGSFRIMNAERDPTWHVPLSIQEEMRRQGRPVITSMPPCTENPLGAHWLGLDRPGYGIHGTNEPASIYGFRTHGCVRLHPEDVAALFLRAGIGTEAHFIYQPVAGVRLPDGRVFLEVHPDIYATGFDVAAEVQRLLEAWGRTTDADRMAADRIVREAAGVARPLDP